jgi:hypothetical protein
LDRDQALALNCFTILHFNLFAHLHGKISLYLKRIKKEEKAVGQVLSRENYDEQGGLMRCAAYISQSTRLWNLFIFSRIKVGQSRGSFHNNQPVPTAICDHYKKVRVNETCRLSPLPSLLVFSIFLKFPT